MQASQDQTTATAQATDTASAPSSSAPAAADATKFVSTGAIPPVAMGTAKTPASASERAFGKGMQALEQALTQGKPNALAVAKLIDAHRDEHDQMLALLHDKLGAAYADTVKTELEGFRASIQNKELVVGDPGAKGTGYFDASQANNGAKWSNASGSFTGTANNKGLDTKVAVNSQDAIEAKVGTTGAATVDWEQAGKTEAELYGSYKASNNAQVGLRKTSSVDGGALTYGVQDTIGANGQTDAAVASYTKGGVTANGQVGVNDGKVSESASVSDKVNSNLTASDSVSHSAGSVSDTLSASDKINNNQLTASTTVTDNASGVSEAFSATDKTKNGTYDFKATHSANMSTLHADANDKLNDGVTLTGSVDSRIPDKGTLYGDLAASQTTANVGETYSKGNIDESLGVQGQDAAGAKSIKATGSYSEQFAPNLYGSAWGNWGYQEGHQDSAQLGASLTFTENEKEALTLAGIVDQNGRLETRLQLDVFQSKIASVQDLDAHKKNAIVSLFISYTQQPKGARLLDDRLGAPEYDYAKDSQIMAGVRVKF